MKTFKSLILLILLVACTKPKPIILYDEAKTSKEDIVSITVPNDIELFKIDDQIVNTPISTSDWIIKIPKGKHSFTVRYYSLWKAPNGENELLKSKKVTFTRILEANKSYMIIHLPYQIKNYDEALEVEKNPKFEIGHLTETEKIQDIIMLPQVKEEQPEKTTPANLAVEQNKESNPKIGNSEKKSLDVLKLIWENSSAEDKKEFLEWVEQEKK